MTRTELIRKVLSFINVESEVDDFDKIHESIEKDIIFRGTNLWILVFAIIVASVGLNMNSTAVIIGAMLISPLMGPINGMGYSLATYNFPLFRKAVRNLSFAVIASIVASTMYFTMSPISTAHSELLARTSPTIYDVLIALFGGLAGILAISSKQKGNVIPGVAIATALMPPLCTAGYGLATGQYNYFFGAFYLFTINTAFIAISSVIISQVLKFPTRQHISKEQRIRVHRLTTFFIIIVLIPSVYFGYKLVEKEKFVESAKKYVNNISVFEGNYLLKNEIDPNAKIIKLVYGGLSLNKSQKTMIIEKAKDFSLANAKIEFHQGLSFDENKKRNSEVENLKAEMNRLNLLLKYKEQQIDSIEKGNILGRQILDEIKTLFPQIVNCSYAGTYDFSDDKSIPDKIDIVVLSTKGKSLSKRDKEKIENWLRNRLKSISIKVYYDQYAESKK
jgi:uncharacterized hydrophobic protein (TIGR00271 family)